MKQNINYELRVNAGRVSPMKAIFLKVILVVSCTVTATPALSQGTIYTTLGPNLTFGTDSLQFGPGTGCAELFTSPVTATVGSASLALQAADPETTLTLTLRATSLIPGHGPGMIVGRFDSTTLPIAPGLVTFTASSAFQLDSGTMYWLAATAPTGQANWFHNDQGIITPTALLIGGTWELDQVSSGGLAFSVSAVPEPAPLALATLGLLAGLVARRHRVRAGG